LDEVDAGRFQRFDEPAGQAQRDTVFMPVLFALASRESNRPWVDERLAIN